MQKEIKRQPSEWENKRLQPNLKIRNWSPKMQNAHTAQDLKKKKNAAGIQAKV